MKVRRDFVTNSSSSSFLLTFKDSSSIYNTLKKQFPPVVENGWSAGENGYLAQLYDEIINAQCLSKEEIESLVISENWEIEWNLEKYLMREKGMSYRETNDYIRSEEGQKILNKLCKEKINRIFEAIGDNEIVVEVEHGDSGEGEDGVLENDILPYLNCTVASFSHH